MSWSLGETRALAVKAARGAGLPWGLAEEAGFAAQWLQRRSAPGVAALAQYLGWRQKNQTAINALQRLSEEPVAGGIYCPLALGSAIADAKQLYIHVPVMVRQPLLLAPFLAISSSRTASTLVFSGAKIILSATTLRTSANRETLLSDQAVVHMHSVDSSDDFTGIAGNHPVEHRRVAQTEVTHIEVLRKLAAHTYAPATTESRLSGAGAGTSDND